MPTEETPLVLSLFPGIGLLDMAFEEEGFCVVRGPDLLWGGDIHRFHPPAGKFDGVIGGPPCQAFSTLRHLVVAQGFTLAANLIPEFERVVFEARPQWFVMENVPDAPLPQVLGYGVQRELICDHWVGGETGRKRSFSFGRQGPGVRFQVDTLALHAPNPHPAILASGGSRERPVKIGGSGKKKQTYTSCHMHSATYFARALAHQGLPADFLSDAPFTVQGKCRVVGNGVPLPMGRAVARAVKKAISFEEASIEAAP